MTKTAMLNRIAKLEEGLLDVIDPWRVLHRTTELDPEYMIHMPVAIEWVNSVETLKLIASEALKK